MENQQVNLGNTSLKRETPYGRTSIVVGIMQIIFNTIGPSLLGIAGIMIFLLNIIATVKAFKQSPQQRKLAIFGIILSIVMIALGLLGLQISGAIFDYFWTKGF